MRRHKAAAAAVGAGGACEPRYDGRPEEIHGDRDPVRDLYLIPLVLSLHARPARLPFSAVLAHVPPPFWATHPLQCGADLECVDSAGLSSNLQALARPPFVLPKPNSPAHEVWLFPAGLRVEPHMPLMNAEHALHLGSTPGFPDAAWETGWGVALEC